MLRSTGVQLIWTRLVRGYVRETLKPHVCASTSGKRRLLNGIAISAVHPSAVIVAADSQIMSKLMSSPPLLIMRSPWIPYGLTTSS